MTPIITIGITIIGIASKIKLICVRHSIFIGISTKWTASLRDFIAIGKTITIRIFCERV